MTRLKRWCLFAVLSLGALSMALAGANTPAALERCGMSEWAQWQDFSHHFISADGRVLAANNVARNSFSEGQSYAMFFSLVANDREAFDRIWQWTQQNLMIHGVNGLPAWIWGQAEDGNWRVLDVNSAADADLWFAYTLLEAGRVWQRTDYQLAGQRMLQAITRQELVLLPGLGSMLLPAPYGFIQADGSWRLNSSYLPLPLLRRFELEVPLGPWSDVAINTLRLARAANRNGYAADWTAYRADSGRAPQFESDSVTGSIGSYDAIRVYLWAGMTHEKDPLITPLLQTLRGMDQVLKVQDTPPEVVNLDQGHGQGVGPFGFSAALLPYLAAWGSMQSLAQQTTRSRELLGQSLLPERIAKSPPPYYDHVLSLFGLGWTENRYRFLINGQVQLKWQEKCSLVSTKSH
jgi:endoglucanase